MSDYAGQIDALTGGDPELAHAHADAILLDAVPEDVREAYKRLQGRCAWWACG